MRTNSDGDAAAIGRIPFGPIVILVAAVASTLLLAARPAQDRHEVRMWTFARLHHQIYQQQVAEWNVAQTPRIDLSLLSLLAIEQRMLSAFLAETTVAELIEVERRNAARAFAGPLESVGFVDLTDRLKAEGLDQAINPASFSPWTTRGRIFGLPHDVHPVMLGYRADIVESAGIDVSKIETWDDFAHVLGPLMADRDADGRPRRYLLNLWETHFEVIELLLLQAGGGLFDSDGRPTLDDPINADVLVQLAVWCAGPDRIAADVPYFSASGNKLLLDGYVIASFVPDWMCNIWRNEIPQLAGKVKLMPLPAWKPGGRRTSVWGGTMLGISRTAANQEALWEFAKYLYLSPISARELYTKGDIVTPVRSLWSDPVFDQPDAYFSGQAKGRMYIELAPHVPVRHSSPFGAIAADRLQTAAISVAAYARRAPGATRAELLSEARRALAVAQADVLANVRRNSFVRADFHEEAGQ
ncbi:MAG: extracellular solute-binding protein [Planctomycetes bacterium]|nr:extracellular solute-binding protein [Planctomycetota bacterium]